jgi:hypothetical protein
MFPLGIPESFYHTLLFEESRVGEKEFEILFRVDRGFEVRVVPLTSSFCNNDDIAGRPRNIAFSDPGYHVFAVFSRRWVMLYFVLSLHLIAIRKNVFWKLLS